MVGSERKIHALEIKVGTSHDEPGVQALRKGSRRMPKAEGALHRRPLPEDIRLVGYAGETLVATGLVNVAFDQEQLDAQLGYEHRSERFPILTVVDVLASGRDEAGFSALLLALLELASDSRFSGGKQVMSIVGVGGLPVPMVMLKDIGYMIHDIPNDTFGAGHLTELQRFGFHKAQGLLRNAQQQGLVPALKDHLPLAHIRLPGSAVSAKHSEREERSSPAHD